MMSPKRTKYRKAHKGRIHGLAKSGTQLNFGAFDQVKVDSNPPGVALLRFELSALPPSTQVVAAELHVYILADTANAGAVSQVFRVLESWDEGTGTSAGTIGAASWQERTAGVAWLAAGAAPPSRDTVVLGQLQPTMADTTYVIPFGPDGLQTIGDWIRDQTSNNGFELVLGSNGGWTFQSGESVHPRPVLVLSVSG